MGTGKGEEAGCRIYVKLEQDMSKPFSYRERETGVKAGASS